MHRVIGQNDIQSTWSKMLTSEQVPHAMILSGDDGYGGLSLALYLVEALLCQRPSEQSGSSPNQTFSLGGCGQCPSCKKMRELTHPDLHIAFPMLAAARKKQGHLARGVLHNMLQANPYLSIDTFLNHFNSEGKKNIAGNITADDVKQILSNLTLSSFAGGWKAQIIWHAERLAKESNKLLKLLEEPPAKTLIILITPNHRHLLTTILSRCQLFQLKPVPYSEVSSLSETALNGFPKPSESQWKLAQYVPGKLFGNGDDQGMLNEAEQLAKELVDLLVQVPSPDSIRSLERSTKQLTSSSATLQLKTLRYAAQLVDDFRDRDRLALAALSNLLSQVALEAGQSIRISTRIMGLWLNLHQKFKL